MRKLILIPTLLLAGCSNFRPPCLEQNEVGTVTRITRSSKGYFETMNLRLVNGTSRVCWVPNGIAKTIAAGDRFTGPLGGGPGELKIHGER